MRILKDVKGDQIVLPIKLVPQPIDDRRISVFGYASHDDRAADRPLVRLEPRIWSIDAEGGIRVELALLRTHLPELRVFCLVLWATELSEPREVLEQIDFEISAGHGGECILLERKNSSVVRERTS